MSTWLIVGASRDIGLEFVRQLQARGNQVIATVRTVDSARQLWALPGGTRTILECDVTSEQSINVRF